MDEGWDAGLQCCRFEDAEEDEWPCWQAGYRHVDFLLAEPYCVDCFSIYGTRER